MTFITTAGPAENGICPAWENDLSYTIPAFVDTPDPAGGAMPQSVVGTGSGCRFPIVPPTTDAVLLGWGLESTTINDIGGDGANFLVQFANAAGDLPMDPRGRGTGTVTGDMEEYFSPDYYTGCTMYIGPIGGPYPPETGTYELILDTPFQPWSGDQWYIEMYLFTDGAGDGGTQGRFYLIWDGDPPEPDPTPSGITAVGLAPPAIVSPPQLAAAPHGLLQTAVEVSESPEIRLGQEVEAWTAGFEFQPEACDQGGVWVPCIDMKTEDLNPGGSGSGSGDQLKSVFDAPEIETFYPYWVEGQFTCSTKGFEVAQYAARALRSLELVTPKQVEHEFWTGDQMANHPNANNQALETEVSSRAQILNSGTIGALVPVSPVQGFALLQQGLANCATGSRGMIHATPYTVEMFIANRLVYQDGQRLSSVTRGTYVVAGSGYPGSGPTIAVGQAAATGTQVWAFATGVVNYRLGRVRLYPNEQDIDAELREAMRPPSNSGEAHGWDNKITYRAERAAAAVWDPCCTVAVLIDLCASGC